MVTGRDRHRAECFLIALGAQRIPHPGGTLYAHLHRVAGLLSRWSASRDLEMAGLCHAAYGTDGFATSLVDIAYRQSVQAVVGPHSEAIIYLYASADRGNAYPQIGNIGRVVMRDRFTDTMREVSDTELRQFTELTAANELDVITHNPDIAGRYGKQLRELTRRASHLLSSEATAAWEELSLDEMSPHLAGK
jgi:hypothetical protein